MLIVTNCSLIAHGGWLNESFCALILNACNCPHRWIYIGGSPFFMRVWRFIGLLQKKSLCMLTSARCFLLSWSTMKTAGSCILDTDGLDNELSVWRCQKSFGSLINHSVCNISTPKNQACPHKYCPLHNEDLLLSQPVCQCQCSWNAFSLSVLVDYLEAGGFFLPF